MAKAMIKVTTTTKKVRRRVRRTETKVNGKERKRCSKCGRFM